MINSLTIIAKANELDCPVSSFISKDIDGNDYCNITVYADARAHAMSICYPFNTPDEIDWSVGDVNADVIGRGVTDRETILELMDKHLNANA